MENTNPFSDADQDFAEIQAAALAELNGNNQADEVPVENPEPVDSEPAAEGAEESQPADEDEDEEVGEASQSVEEKIAEAVKAKEKELKKRYLSEISRLKKDNDSRKNGMQEKLSQYDSDSLSAIEELVEVKLQDKAIRELEAKEERNFFKKNEEAGSIRSEIEAIREEIPGISWESAYKLYKADNPTVVAPKPTKALT